MVRYDPLSCTNRLQDNTVKYKLITLGSHRKTRVFGIPFLTYLKCH